MIEEEYVNFETAKLLKEKGFNEKSRYYYRDHDKALVNVSLICGYSVICNEDLIDDYAVPTQQMAMRWLREVHNIQIELNWNKGNQLYNFQIWKPGKYQPEISSLDLWRIYKDDNYLGEWNYEEAAEEAIQYSLKNLI